MNATLSSSRLAYADWLGCSLLPTLKFMLMRTLQTADVANAFAYNFSHLGSKVWRRKHMIWIELYHV
ncbi:hypothetical protein D5086_000584 [Populus alba]|uniref:Uncharacterized protein n=1 Tax=Populus alba TaxID=43335 RepID=A0ACC4CXN7_POPAL